MTFGDGRDTPGAVVEPAADYDRFVDWNKRLAREAPFFRHEFGAHAVRRIIDVGCGTGQHAIMWAGWGLEVVGVDPSASMLAQARINAKAEAERVAAAGGSVTFVEGGFGELAALGLAPADAVTCTGNALPHVSGLPGLREAIADFAAVLRPGGACILHLLNHDRLLAGRIRSIAPVVRETDDGTWVFLRVIDYVEAGIGFDFVTLHRPTGGYASDAAWETSSRRSVHTALPSAVLRGELEANGFSLVRAFGNHEALPFEADRDESVILVGTKG
ncbi:MAG: class I SAM-dependent methyltransferase [Coriobacteriia bacterium]|nr:class I SAM-dependent methyltransferase [Coriobacteriia bacterium]